MEAPAEVRQAMVSETLTLNKLDTERLFKSMCAKPQYQCVMRTGAQYADLSDSFKVSNYVLDHVS